MYCKLIRAPSWIVFNHLLLYYSSVHYFAAIKLILTHYAQILAHCALNFAQIYQDFVSRKVYTGGVGLLAVWFQISAVYAG